MPLPAVPLLVKLWALKTGGTYVGYKQLKKHKPELVEEWEAKAKEIKGQVNDFLFGKEEGANAAPPAENDNDDGGAPPAP